MKRIVLITIIAVLSAVCFDHAQAQVSSPLGGNFPATLYESDKWDGPYKVIAGPVNINSTGCLLQKFGSRYYALFGSADRKYYVYSYPDLKQLGALDSRRAADRK